MTAIKSAVSTHIITLTQVSHRAGAGQGLSAWGLWGCAVARQATATKPAVSTHIISARAPGSNLGPGLPRAYPSITPPGARAVEEGASRPGIYHQGRPPRHLAMHLCAGRAQQLHAGQRLRQPRKGEKRERCEKKRGTKQRNYRGAAGWNRAVRLAASGVQQLVLDHGYMRARPMSKRRRRKEHACQPIHGIRRVRIQRRCDGPKGR